MRVLITSFGTRGDIQPYAALGGALRERGHDVLLAVPDGFRDLVEGTGVGLHPAGSRMLATLQDVMPELSGARDAVQTIGIMRDAMREHIDEQWSAARAATPDVIVYHPKCLAGPHMAEALGVPGLLSIPLPFYTPTREFPIPFLGGVSLGSRGNRASYAFTRAVTVLYGGMINDFRRRIGLQDVGRFADPLRNPDGSAVHVLYPYSRHLLPVPRDFPPSAHVTGYWFLPRDAAWEPDPRLVDFLSAGDPPISVGFGSMGFGKGAGERYDAVVGALKANRLRAVITTGWGGLRPGGAVSDDVFVTDAVPHDWLFDRVSAVVHHGGAGSTAAGLRAGKPTLICPFLGDQPFWGACVRSAGVGPAPLSARRLARGLTGRLGELTDSDEYRARAARMADLIRSEDGVGCGARLVEDRAPA